MTMFHVFGGDAEHPLAREAVGSLQKGIVLLASDDWRELLFEIHGGRIMAQPRTALSSAALELDRLRALARRVPQGFCVERIDAGMASRMSGELEEPVRLHAFRSPQDFAERGIGFATLHGERTVCVATSFVVCSRGIEIQIVTHPDFRRRGLATATSAALMAHCLEHDLEPEWDADNPESLKLAQKLGYTQPEPYEWLILLPE
jgi:RimJ/RimL family protein N-acetyltransferase